MFEACGFSNPALMVYELFTLLRPFLVEDSLHKFAWLSKTSAFVLYES